MESRQDRRAEAVDFGLDHRVVDRLQDASHTRLPHRESPDRVLREAGHRGRLRSPAAHVPDHQAPRRPVDPERVVEVAPDLDATPRSMEQGRQLELRDRGRFSFRFASQSQR